jgi:ABC-type transport system involved in multi-copper enzyme maturation permease subunit
MRGWRSAAIIVLYLGLLALVSYLLLSSSLSGQGFSANQATSLGLNLFNTLALLQGALIIFITPAATSGAISGERQRQTLDLLLVTKLSSFGITSGKLLAAIAFDLLLIVCALPVFSLVFLFGGIGLDKVIELVALFVMSILCFGSIGLMVSALTRRSNAATVITYVAVLVLVAGLACITLYLYASGYASTDSSSAAPLSAYFDPGLGMAALLYSQDPSFAVQLPFSVWGTSVLTCAVITSVCVSVSTAALRRQRS